MIRKYAAILAFCCVCNYNNAQLNVWKNYGINYSTINTPNHKDFKITPKFRINAGVAFQYSLNNNFSIEPEVNIAQKGARLVGITPNGWGTYIPNTRVHLFFINSSNPSDFCHPIPYPPNALKLGTHFAITNAFGYY